LLSFIVRIVVREAGARSKKGGVAVIDNNLEAATGLSSDTLGAKLRADLLTRHRGIAPLGCTH